MEQKGNELDLLRQVELFQGIDWAELQLIAEEMTERPYADGEVVFRKGDAGDELFMLLSGLMHVYVERDNNVISYNRLQAGEFFGERALLEDVPRSATVQAEAPSTCLTLSRQGFMDLMNRHPQTVFKIMKGLVPRLRRTNVQLQDYASRLANMPDVSPVVMSFTE